MDDRRRFLKTKLGPGLGLAAAGPLLLLPRKGLALEPPRVVVAKGGRTAAVRAAVERLGGMSAFVKPGQKVVIKPNMSFARMPDSATNTHPEVVAELVKMVQEAQADQVLVLDNTFSFGSLCLERSGIGPAVARLAPDSTFSLSARRFFTARPIPGHTAMYQTEVMKQVLEADVLIAAPQAKSHSATGVSLSMKGMMGLIHDRRVMHGIYDLDESIVDLASLIPARLTVIDASRVLTTGGPGGPGRVIEPLTIIASPDMVAADAMTVSLFPWYGKQYKPRQVRHIKLAHQRGLGRMDIENLPIETLNL